MSRRTTDYLAIAIAISLPWSTTATGAFLMLWLLAALPTADWAGLRKEILTPAGGLPLLLCAWALLGILWAADASWKESFAGFREFHKLLLVPVFLAYFARSSRNLQTVIWFFASCVVLLALSFIVTLWPRIQWWHSMSPGVPFKSYITQSAEFTMSAFFFFCIAADAWKERARKFAVFSFCLGLAFIGNILFIATSRTELIIIAVLIVLFGAHRWGMKGALAGVFVLSIGAVLVWNSSSYLRERIDNAISEIQMYRIDNQRTSLGLRLEFWRKSIEFIDEAPFIGHGTGSIRSLFQNAATGETGISSAVTLNPHNQTFAVAIQLGLVGAVILCAMWGAHLWMFRGPGLPAWIGLTVVIQNIIGSFFSSHLFDFAEGWIYVCLVGAPRCRLRIAFCKRQF
jgi:O-antigen ligase